MITINLKSCREEMEMTQTELGYIFGVSKATVANWENGYGVIPLKKLIKFSNYSNYSLNYICGLTRINHIYNNKEKVNKEKIGKRLKEFRKHLGLSQQKFSDACHIPQSTYSHYEIGYKLITTFICTQFPKHIMYL